MNTEMNALDTDALFGPIKAVARPIPTLKTLAALDQRTKAVRRFQQVLAALHSDLGGVDRLSEAQKQLAQRCGFLSLQCEQLEAACLTGDSIALDMYGQLTDRLGRNLQRLGLKRVMHDVVPDLREYIASPAPAKATKPRKRKRAGA
jgi:hypothetical protein